MIRFRALGVRFSLPLLALLTPLLARRLGLRGGMGALAIALGAHELAHLAAARAARVGIREIRLTPFGGSAQIENPYRLSPAQLAAVAAAGPCANLLLALASAALAQWAIISPGAAARAARANLTLALFNLIPALPLDGGRMLYALLQHPLGERRAQSLGAWLGHALAAALIAAGIAGGFARGKWNLTFFLVAAFLIASARDERDALGASGAIRLEEALETDSEPRPARIYQLDANTSAARALSLIRPRERAWFVLTRGGRPEGLLDGGTLMRHILAGAPPDSPIGALRGLKLCAPEHGGASRRER